MKFVIKILLTWFKCAVFIVSSYTRLLEMHGIRDLCISGKLLSGLFKLKRATSHFSIKDVSEVTRRTVVFRGIIFLMGLVSRAELFYLVINY